VDCRLVVGDTGWCRPSPNLVELTAPIQKGLPNSAVVAPVVLASDKTSLTQFGGDKTAYPVYMTIGNISKDVRRQTSSWATALLSYIPVSKLKSSQETGDVRKVAVYHLFQDCM